MTIEILTSDAAIAQKVKAAIYKESKKGPFLIKLQRMTDAIYDLLERKFIESEVFASLAGGILRAEFGLDDFEVSNLGQVIRDILLVTAEHQSKGGAFRILIEFIDPNFDMNNTGLYSYKDRDGDTVDIYWLYWLLTQDEAIIVPDYAMALKAGAGRSEMAIMIKPKSGGSYSVDGYFAGKITDNWVTRTIRGNIKEIEKIIKDTLSNAA